MTFFSCIKIAIIWRYEMCKLLDLAREKQETTYYGIAKMLGVSTPVLNKWIHDKSKPNGLNTLRLADLAGLSTKEAIRIVEGGFVSLPILFVTSFGSTLALAWSYISPTVYIMLNRNTQRSIALL